MRVLVAISKTLVVAILSLSLAEFALRAVRSLGRDGVLHLSSPSAEIEPHPRYGWISSSSQRVKKSDDCYGRGWVTYNEVGFRAPAMEQAVNADIVICILGDSVIHGFQLADGQHLPHLLEDRLRQDYSRPFVLPLAVGGYGSVQQWMLFEDYCRELDPAVVIQHWSVNDALNNSYFAERYSGPVNNNARPRPYLEDGRLVVRRPYPVRLSDQVDRLLLTRVLNTLILRWNVRPELVNPGLEHGWEVAEEVTRRLATTSGARIALVEKGDRRASEMFRRNGFRLAIHEPFTAEETCLPHDPHPNAAGHRRLLAALWPVLEESLQETGGLRQGSATLSGQFRGDGGTGRAGD
jgi:hypothetical protein